MAPETATAADPLQELSDGLHGRLIRPGDPDYDDARAVWNGMIDREPAAIARCSGAADVMAAVKHARERELVVSVRAGGHSVAGKSVCDDGLMIDLSGMDGVRVDPEARRVRVGAGATWADVDHETQAFGLATTGGLVSTTGVAGLTLGGGIGYLARNHGLAMDNLLSLRGAGGNFGVVTSMEFQLHEVGPEVMVAQLFHPVDAARDVLELYRELTADAPDELACYALLAHVPPGPPFPEAWHGKTTIALVALHSGDLDEGRRMLEPLADFGDPILALAQPMPYAVVQQSFDDGAPKGGRYYWKSHYLDEVSDGVVDAILEHADPLPGPLTLVGLEPLGGAVARVGPTETAYPHREARFAFGVWSGWTEPEQDEEMIEWTRRFHRAVEPHARGGSYANYLSEDEDARSSDAFGDNYERLVQLKNEWDPTNFFRMNSNVEPTV